MQFNIYMGEQCRLRLSEEPSLTVMLDVKKLYILPLQATTTSQIVKIYVMVMLQKYEISMKWKQ